MLFVHFYTQISCCLLSKRSSLISGKWRAVRCAKRVAHWAYANYSWLPSALSSLLLYQLSQQYRRYNDMKLASRYDFKVSNESAARAEVESFFIKTLDWLMTGDNSASPQVLGLATGDWSSILGDCDTLLVNVSRVWVTRYTQYPIPSPQFQIPNPPVLALLCPSYSDDCTYRQSYVFPGNCLQFGHEMNFGIHIK